MAKPPTRPGDVLHWYTTIMEMAPTNQFFPDGDPRRVFGPRKDDPDALRQLWDMFGANSQTEAVSALARRLK